MRSNIQLLSLKCHGPITAPKRVPVNTTMRMLAKRMMVMNNVTGDLTGQGFGLVSLSLTRLIN